MGSFFWQTRRGRGSSIRTCGPRGNDSQESHALFAVLAIHAGIQVVAACLVGSCGAKLKPYSICEFNEIQEVACFFCYWDDDTVGQAALLPDVRPAVSQCDVWIHHVQKNRIHLESRGSGLPMAYLYSAVNLS